MKLSYEQLAELRKAEPSEKPQPVQTVIYGYYALSDKDRALVDKNIRKFKKAIDNNETPTFDLKGHLDD